MKAVVIGGSGRVGSQVVAHLSEQGAEALPASPDSGVDTISGTGVAAALAGAEVVVDASNAPDFEDRAALAFFRTSTSNLLAAAAAAAVRHYVVFSIVGADRLPDSGYLRAKLAQEELVRGGQVPFTIVRATQFFEFVGSIADASTVDGSVRLPPVLFQPAAAGEIAAAVAEIAAGEPAGGVVEVGGPEPLRFDQALAAYLEATGDERRVVADPHATYFGTELNRESLTTERGARLTATHFADWLVTQTQRREKS